MSLRRRARCPFRNPSEEDCHPLSKHLPGDTPYPTSGPALTLVYLLIWSAGLPIGTCVLHNRGLVLGCVAYQFDLSHEIVLIDGVTTTVKVAHVRLCHSRMLFVRDYPRETQGMVFDAHDKPYTFIDCITPLCHTTASQWRRRENLFRKFSCLRGTSEMGWESYHPSQNSTHRQHATRY